MSKVKDMFDRSNAVALAVSLKEQARFFKSFGLDGITKSTVQTIGYSAVGLALLKLA